MASDIRLSLFPLNTVLLPGMPLPLHVFEERYKQMIGDCLDGTGVFGVVLLRGVQEVGAPIGADDWERVGTMARIVSYEPLGDGQLAVNTRGTERFETVSVEQEGPYPIVTARPAPLRRAAAGVRERAEDLLDLYGRFVRRAQERGLLEVGELPEHPEPERLAWFIAATLPIEAAARQRLLMKESLEELLEAEIRLLAEDLP